ncbi:MAG: hypothetical protein ACI9K3_000587 [Halovenus sp.]|jgi:hypothetical protein
MISDTVAHVAGITGRSSPAREWWGCRPRKSFGTGEERPSSPATTEGESHIKAPPSTSEVARPSEVGRGRLLPVRARDDIVFNRNIEVDRIEDEAVALCPLEEYLCLPAGVLGV